MKQISLILGLAVLASCSPADNEPGPGGVTVGEARALDEAAEMIEAKRLPTQDAETDAEVDGDQQVEPLELTEATEE